MKSLCVVLMVGLFIVCSAAARMPPRLVECIAENCDLKNGVVNYWAVLTGLCCAALG